MPSNKQVAKRIMKVMAELRKHVEFQAKTKVLNMTRGRGSRSYVSQQICFCCWIDKMRFKVFKNDYLSYTDGVAYFSRRLGFHDEYALLDFIVLSLAWPFHNANNVFTSKLAYVEPNDDNLTIEIAIETWEQFSKNLMEDNNA